MHKKKLIKSLNFKSLTISEDKLTFLGESRNYVNLINFTKNIKDRHQDNYEYENESSIVYYKNFLKWLFKTFKISEKNFRKDWINYLKLKKGQKVLITSSGLGGDIKSCLDLVGKDGEIHAQDLSLKFVK